MQAEAEEEAELMRPARAGAGTHDEAFDFSERKEGTFLTGFPRPIYA